MNKKLGLIVNPIAGIGGRVGLKGSDGREIVEKALRLGAVPESPKRAVDALKRIALTTVSLELITYPVEMGENEAKECGFKPTVIGSVKRGGTTSFDTENAAKEMLKLKVDLLLFAGGDGTARDICNIIDAKIPSLGIPTGVKIHSAVFATSPRNAGDLVTRYLEEEDVSLREAEVMDIDEQAFRENRLASRLYGYLRIPYVRGLVQDAKAGSVPSDEASMDAIADDVISNMSDDYLYLVGPGTTAKVIMRKLGLSNALLGVDVVYKRKLVGSDLNETQLLNMISGKKAKIIVSVVGRQGYLFGRGNQQISARAISKVGKEDIIAVATHSKLLSLEGNPLLVDTGDAEIDNMLSGYIQVVTGFGERAVLRIMS